MRPLRHHHPGRARRQGLTTPVVVLALLITMTGLALILDRIWLETAQLELTTAAETTALAAARQLAQDDRLVPNLPEQQRRDAALTAAELAAGLNRVAGETPNFSFENDDLLFGRYSHASAGQPIVFQTDAADPNSVRVTLHRSRGRNNPVALFIGQLTGIPFGNVNRQADAAVNNQIEGIRPVHGAMAPALPLAVWKVDPAGKRTDTWDEQIEKRRGPDNYRYDSARKQPVRGEDGLPELTVRSLPRGGRPELCNVQVVDLGSGFDDEILQRQFLTGWTESDLDRWGGTLNPGAGLSLTGSPDLLHQERESLEALLGEPRICLLFSTAVPQGKSKRVLTTCVSLVAVRVMSVEDQPDGSCLLVLQPTVIATRSALVTAAVGQTSTAAPNKYIYNLQLTN